MGAVRSIFESMVSLSDDGDLMSKFLGLPCPNMFMLGDQNASLSHLDQIGRHGVRLVMVPHCGHFSMYSNPVFTWQSIVAFQECVEE